MFWVDETKEQNYVSVTCSYLHYLRAKNIAKTYDIPVQLKKIYYSYANHVSNFVNATAAINKCMINLIYVCETDH